MLNGLLQLAWLEVKIFVREPLGVFGSVIMPVLLFVVLGRMMGRSAAFPVQVPVLVAMLIALGAVLSLVTIIAIYREGGILKRLRATPLRPHTILTAHVVVKLLLTAVTAALMLLAGRRYIPPNADVPLLRFAAALLVTTLSMLSIGFVIASLVPTARFAQPIGSLLLYPMLAVSGAFAPIEIMPPALRILARMLPPTYAVSLLKGIWRGDPWSAHVTDLAVLAAVFAAGVAISSRVFRWE
jgi:ABC-2 type transport system permease protein